MQIAEALLLERLGLRRGIIVEDGRCSHVAELQAHAGAIFQIDRREQDHAGGALLLKIGIVRDNKMRLQGKGMPFVRCNRGA